MGRDGGGHDSTDDTEMASLSNFLLENNVKHSIRKGRIRLSLHLYNTEEDVAEVLALTKSWRGASAAT